MFFLLCASLFSGFNGLTGPGSRGSAGLVYAQGVTSGSMRGTVTDGTNPIAGASVIAIHEPSGTSYEATTRADGKFSIPSMRVGGPYSVQVVYVGTGTAFEPKTVENLTVNLGLATDVTVTVRNIAVQENVTVTAETDPVFSSNRTGAATQISRDDLANLPNISGRLENITRLTPQQSGEMSFAGQDARANNITVDGAYFNNSFGLAATPGDRTNVAAISTAAIEQVQVSVAPYDVRQGNFVGAAVNTVTRSGTNKLAGSFYHAFRNQSMVGTQAKALTVNPGTFTYGNTGGWAGGPVQKNKLFFFGSYESEALTQPGTSFRANNGGEPAVGNVTRVLASDLDGLAAYLKKNFNNYDPGVYQGYNFATPAKRGVAKADYNLNNSNKVSFRYIQLNSSTPVLESNSSSLGNGGRRTPNPSLNFSNSNYTILENIKSGVGEWNSVIGKSMANRVIAGYTTNDESRGPLTKLFPLVDILDGAGTTYTSFGSEPFTPNNELRYHTFQAEDDFTKFSEKHALTFGATFQKYHSQNVFFPGQQSVYVYKTLADFYSDANDYLANSANHGPGGVAPVVLQRFQARYINVPNATKPIQPLDVIYGGAYVGDDWSLSSTFKLTPGVRFDVPKFGDTGFDNAQADGLTFRDENGNAVHFNTKKLPDPKLLWSPRVGFNWDATSDQKTQVRGGTGIFTGPPPYVYISNQIGNTGVLTGLVQPADNTTAFPFNPNPSTYKPAGPPTGAPSATYELALTDPSFKFPQVWRSNVAVDRRVFGWTATGEYIYNRDVNGIYYINANLPAPQAAYTGVDNRPRWVATTPIIATRLPNNQQVIDAIVLKNESIGRSWNAALSLQRTFSAAFFVKGAYSYGEAKNTVDPSSIAFGNWSTNAISGNPNNAPLSFSSASPGHRVFIAASYTKDFFGLGNTTISTFWDAHTNRDLTNSFSYVFAGDANGDGATSNDLIYIPRNTSEMNFVTFSSGGTTFTSADQAAAWDAYIAQDKYLRKHRGQYAERNAIFFPMVKRMDLSFAQDLSHNVAGQRHGFQFRIDILNFGNLLNHNWGVGQQQVNGGNSPLTNPAVDANGALSYRMRAISGKLLDHTFDQTADVKSDTYRFQITLKYLFN
jgi:hypothetical protein